MTTIADLISRESRARLISRAREIDELGQLMRQPGGLAEAPEPVPLHRSRDTTTERTTP